MPPYSQANNLLSKKDIKTMLAFCSKKSNFNAKILNVKLFGVPSNWILFAQI